MTDEEKRKNLRERFNKVRMCCNNSAYTRPHDYDTPPKRSLWQRVKDLFRGDVIVRSIYVDPLKNRFYRIFRNKCNHVWGHTAAHDVFFRSNNNRRPVECEKCCTLKWVSLEEYQNIHKNKLI